MPEGPELFKAAQFINKCATGRIFRGKIVKSEISTKNPDIETNVSTYTISANSRGKELMIKLFNYEESQIETKGNFSVPKDVKIKIEEEEAFVKPFCCIVFNFGMSGCFRFCTPDNLHKHSHLRFYTEVDDFPMVLSFVDSRRFGRWRVSDSFSSKRGPDPVFEYKQFRAHILDNVDSSIFEKAICEVMHDQKYFNGIGNYLRAEILYRAKIPPFEKAYNVLKDLKRDKREPERKKKKPFYKQKLKRFGTDFVEDPLINFTKEGAGYEKLDETSDYLEFQNWLQCYYQPEMNNLVDREKRTIWFQGPAGPLVPKGSTSRHGVKNNSKKHVKKEPKDLESEPSVQKKASKRKLAKESLQRQKVKTSKRQMGKKQLNETKQYRQGVRSSKRLKGIAV